MPHHARKNRAGRNEHAKRSLRTALSDTESKISKQFRHASTEVEEKHPHNAEADWFKEINCSTRLRRKNCDRFDSVIERRQTFQRDIRKSRICGWVNIFLIAAVEEKEIKDKSQAFSKRSFSFDPFNRSLYLNFKDTKFMTHLRPARYVQPPWGQDVKARALMDEMI